MKKRMKQIVLCTLVFMFAAWGGTYAAERAGGKAEPGKKRIEKNEEQPSKKLEKVEIRVAEKDWGGVRRATVKRHLDSVAREIWVYFPGRKLKPIIVEPRGGPIVLYRRGKQGEYFIKLNTGGTLWAQYAYQFAHEFCHVLCNYDPDVHGNDWFEESICELASLFVLRKMGESWKTRPPFSHWKSYAKHLTSYAQKRIDQYKLKKGETLAKWYKSKVKQLAGSATKRDLNSVVAVALLDLFEKEPRHWRAVGYMNVGKPGRQQSLGEFLGDWKKNSPREHRGFIDKIVKRFGIEVK